MAFCIECGTQLKRTAVSCPECGHPVDDEDTATREASPARAPRRARPRTAAAKPPPRTARATRRPKSSEHEARDAAELQEPPLFVDLAPAPGAPTAGGVGFADGPGVLAARIAGIFAVVGFGLGVASLLFLWESGFFDVSAGESFEDFAKVAIGAFALAAVAAFAVPLGIVVAAVGGVFAAVRTPRLAEAVRAGAIGAAAGYLALTLVLSGFVVLAIELREGREPDPEPSPTSQAQQSCEQIFGEGSPQCRNIGAQGDLNVQGDIDVFGDVSDNDGWSDDIARLGLGIIPTALVGALSAAVTSSRRRRAT